MHIYPWQMDYPPINHTSMLNCYIQEVSHITECTYTHDRLTPCQLTIDPCYTITPSPCQLTIDPCYTITPPLPIDHRSMQHHYTPSISHSAQCTYTHGRPIHHSSFTCSSMPWQTYPIPPPIKHGCMQNYYTQ